MSLRCLTHAAFVAAVAAVGCSPAHAPASGAFVRDDFGDSVRVGPAVRIVSLNPVVTEFLFAAGAGPRVVGRTHWDHYPTAADAVPDLGDGIGPNVEAVLGARPDLVLLYACPSNRRAATGLQQAGVRTLTVRTDHIADLRRLADIFAAVTGDSAGNAVVDTVLASVDAVRRLPRPAHPVRAFWLMFDDAPRVYALGHGSFVHELLELAGAANAFDDVAAPSAQVSIEEVIRRNPDVIVASPVSARRLRQSATWNAVPAVRAGRIVVSDSALVGRPGMRLGEAARHVRRLLVADSVPQTAARR